MSSQTTITCPRQCSQHLTYIVSKTFSSLFEQVFVGGDLSYTKLYYSHKKQKDSLETRTNWTFNALMLRTKLYYKLFFLIGDQNINKPKSRTTRTVYGPIRFYKIIVSFLFFLSKCKQNKIKLCYNRLQFVKKKHKLILHKTQNREFFFSFYQELPVQNLFKKLQCL